MLFNGFRTGADVEVLSDAAVAVGVGAIVVGQAVFPDTLNRPVVGLRGNLIVPDLDKNKQDTVLSLKIDYYLKMAYPHSSLLSMVSK